MAQIKLNDFSEVKTQFKLKITSLCEAQSEWEWENCNWHDIEEQPIQNKTF